MTRVSSLRVPGPFALLWAAALLCLASLLFWAAAAKAQDDGASPLGFTSDPDAPIEIEADSLEVQQSDNVATFAGNVIAVQDTVRLRSDVLKVFYQQDDDGSEASLGGGAAITSIDARGNVVVTSEDDQTAEADWAIYDVGTREITMGGGEVVLRQEENVIRGTKLFIDLDTGFARVTAERTPQAAAGGGRVRGLFKPPEETGGDTPTQ